MNKRSGTTIVSLIVGMALGAFLIAAILQIFVTTKNNYKLSQNIAEMNDAMRFAVTRITNMVSYAGHMPSGSVAGGTGLPPLIIPMRVRWCQVICYQDLHLLLTMVQKIIFLISRWVMVVIYLQIA